MSKRKSFHKKVIEGYHTKVCEEEKNNKCPFDFFKCFDSHESEYLRRKPMRITNEKGATIWNYCPEMCFYLEKGFRCSNGQKCFYAHSNDERVYHPENFKKSLCNSFSANTSCPRGEYCFKAHGKDDFNLLDKNDFDFYNNERLIFG